MKHIKKYNHLFFTEESKNSASNMNGEFWQRMSDFDRLHPEADLCVIHTIKKHLGNYVEHLEFQCCQESEKKQVIEIYNQHYHLYPLSFYTFLEREPTCEELVYLEGKPQ